MTLFSKNYSKHNIEESFRNILLIHQFSLEDIRIMKSKKDDTILQLTQQIRNLIFNDPKRRLNNKKNFIKTNNFLFQIISNS